MANGIYDLINRYVQDAKNYASIPATYGAALYGNYINPRVGENMARAFRTDEMNERLSQQVGDKLSTGVNSGSLTYTDFGLDPVKEYIGGGKFRDTRNFNPPSFEKAMSLNSADLANAYTIGNLNFNRDPSGNINYTGNRFDFPQPTFMNDNPIDIPLDELNVNRQRFSVTQPSQFDTRQVPEVPGTNVMKGSVVEDVVDTPTREFGDMRVGRPDQAIFGDSVGQRFNMENNPELFFNTAAGQAKADEEQDFFDYLQSLSGGVVDFAKDITGRTIASQALGGAGGMFSPYLAVAGGITGLLRGGNMFNQSYDPFYKQFADSSQRGAGFKDKYGINTISAFGDYGKYALDKAYGINALSGDKGDFYRDVVAKKNAAMTDANVGFGDQDSGGDTTGSGGPQSMGSAQGGAGGRPY